MASRNRLRQDINKILVEQFRDWGLPRDIEYKSYCSIVDKPVVPRAIQKSFYNWNTAVHSVAMSNPEIFQKAAPAPKAEPKPAAVKSEPAKAAPAEEKSDD